MYGVIRKPVIRKPVIYNDGDGMQILANRKRKNANEGARNGLETISTEKCVAIGDL